MPNHRNWGRPSSKKWQSWKHDASLREAKRATVRVKQAMVEILVTGGSATVQAVAQKQSATGDRFRVELDCIQMTNWRDHDWLLLNGGAKTRLGSGLSIEREAEMLRAVVEFLNRNGLAKQTIPVRDDWEGFELRRSQLTENGYAFLSKQLPKWLTGIDRGKAPLDTSSMSRALTKFQAVR